MLQYNDITRDEGKLPQASVAALLSRGFAHYMGNEQAAKVSARIGKALSEGKPDTYEPTRDEYAAFRTGNAAQVNAWKAEIIAEALKALDEGTVGVRAPGAGVSRDPVESGMRRIARVEVTKILKDQGLKVPTGEKTVHLGEADFTMDDLIDRRIVKHGERIRKESEQAIAAEARKLARVTGGADEL
jgi:hypothetical protein